MNAEAKARVVVVGAGPAGIRASGRLVAAGLHPTVIDEGARAGGQIYRRPPLGFKRGARDLYGSEARKAERLHRLFDTMVSEGSITYLDSASVTAIAHGALHVLRAGRVVTVEFDRLIIATGATDRIAPVPGWETGGVFTLGAAQIALKAQGLALGKSIALAGSGPLLMLVATQLRAAGANVVAVLDTSSIADQARGLGDLATRPLFLLRGLLMRLKLGGLYKAGVSLERIVSEGGGPHAIKWRTSRGAPRTTPCDTVCLGWHLRSETHLADLAGARFSYDEVWRQWLPVTDASGRAGQGVYLAGDGMQPLGADAAEVTGNLAASACLSDLGFPVPDDTRALAYLGRLRRFARGIAKAFPWPAEHVRRLPSETVLCRCENISVAQARDAADLGGLEVNRIKSLGRVGMGRCQGRYCQLGEIELAASWKGCGAGEVGRLRPQAPIRPTPISAWLDHQDGSVE